MVRRKCEYGSCSINPVSSDERFAKNKDGSFKTNGSELNDLIKARGGWIKCDGWHQGIGREDIEAHLKH